MFGEPIDLNKHELLVDVKAVTMHLFEVKKLNGEWFARVIVDV
jgi:SHS2 domain-containing protein